MSHALAVMHGAFGRAALYRLDRPITTHAHREGHLIFAIDGPAARVTVDRADRPVDGISAVAVNPWQAHAFLTGADSQASVCLVLYLKPVWYSETNRRVGPHLSLRFGQPTVAVTPLVRRLTDRLAALLLAGEPLSGFDEVLCELTWECLSQSWHRSPNISPLSGADRRQTDFRIRKALCILSENFRGAPEMDRVARAAGLSRPHFFKLFKLQMGITPNLYLNMLRSEAAIQDLTQTAKSVTDISLDLGFASQASFTRFFACNVGIPPSEYRRAAQCAAL